MNPADVPLHNLARELRRSAVSLHRELTAAGWPVRAHAGAAVPAEAAARLRRGEALPKGVGTLKLARELGTTPAAVTAAIRRFGYIPPHVTGTVHPEAAELIRRHPGPWPAREPLPEAAPEPDPEPDEESTSYWSDLAEHDRADGLEGRSFSDLLPIEQDWQRHSDWLDVMGGGDGLDRLHAAAGAEVSIDHAAEILDVPAGTIRVWVHRGKLSPTKYANVGSGQRVAHFSLADVLDLRDQRAARN